MASGKVNVNVYIPDLTRLRRHLGPTLYSAAWARYIRQGGQVLEAAAYKRVPVGETFNLASSITLSVDQSPFPTWAKVTASAVSEGGFRYGWALQNSKKVTYHYLHGPRTGRKTRRWFSGAMGVSKKKLIALLRTAARDVEARWRR